MTTDRNDPLLKEHHPDGQQKAHMVLSAEERAKGFTRPLRDSYVHSGAGPFCGEAHTNADGSVSNCTGAPDHEGECSSWMEEGRFQLHESGCDATTKMGSSIAETYARNPDYYGSTYCSGCGAYFPVGEFGEFTWHDGSKVGS